MVQPLVECIIVTMSGACAINRAINAGYKICVYTLAN
jgi:hypothetical protein